MSAAPTFGQSAPLVRTVADVDIGALAQARIPGLRKVARTGGGEWHGPCPACGGEDRFIVNATGGDDGRGLYWCRQCGVTGDAVSLVQLLDHVTAVDAFRTLGIGQVGRSGRRWEPPPLPSAPQEPVEPPPEAWRARAQSVLMRAEGLLWSEAGAKLRAYLHQRGLTDATIRAGRLGYIPEDVFDDRSRWGLEPRDTAGRHQTRLSLSRGLLIPYLVEGAIWRLEVRRPVPADAWAARDRTALRFAQRDATGQVWRALVGVPYATAHQLTSVTGLDAATVGEVLDWLRGEHLLDRPAKYVTIAGSANAVWGLDDQAPGRPGVMVEGVINGLSIRQEAGDLVNVAALGATTHGRRPRWVGPLTRWAGQLIALDSDDDPAKGDAAAAWWLDVLQPTAIRWRPLANDANAMLVGGHDLRAWVAAGIAELELRRTPEPTAAAAPTRACPRCGQVLSGVAELCPDCAQPAPAWRGWDGEEGGSTPAERVPPPVAPQEGVAEEPANPNADYWWGAFEAALERAGEEAVTLWNAYQDAIQAHQPVAALVEELRAGDGRVILRAWNQWKSCCRMESMLQHQGA